MAQLAIDCAGCKMARSMIPAKIPKFSGIVRFIGFVIVIPSVLGVGLAVLMFFASGSATSQVMQQASTDAEITGAAIGSAMTFGASAFVGISSLVGGLIGWLLIMKKKVFKCRNCGYVMDRD